MEACGNGFYGPLYINIMLTNNYVVTGKTLVGSVVFKYDLNGVLREFVNQAELSAEQLKWFATHIPFTEEMIAAFIESAAGKLKAELLKHELTFDLFWREYGNKKGSKAETEKLWNGEKVTENKRPVTEADRIAIFKMLPKLNYHYQINKKELPYPTTFLNQRRWENEF